VTGDTYRTEQSRPKALRGDNVMSRLQPIVLLLAAAGLLLMAAPPPPSLLASAAYAQQDSNGGMSGQMPGMKQGGGSAEMAGMKAGDMKMPGMEKPDRSRLWIVLGLLAGLFAVVSVVLSRRRGMDVSPRKLLNRQAVIGVLILAVMLVAVRHVVKKNRKPGSMTVVEAQAMDMSVMKPPVGAAPVAIETVGPRDFSASVTYSGVAVANSDEDVYPRVVGKIVSLPVYPGDTVKPGQLVARLDSVELSAREREALYGRAAADRARDSASAQSAQATAGRVQADAEVSRAKGAATEAEQNVTRAQAALGESQSNLQAAQAETKQAQNELKAAGHEKEIAQADLTNAQAGLEDANAEVEQASAEVDSVKSNLPQAEAEVESAQADAAYWGTELKREAKLVKDGAISQEEFDREEAQAKAATARLRQAEAKVGQVKHNIAVATAAVRSTQAKAKQRAAQIQRAQADLARLDAKIEGAKAMVAAKEASRESATARIAQNKAEVETAAARVEQSRASIRSAEALVSGSRAAVRASAARTAEAEAMVGQSSAGLTAAATVRGYTEIRATVSGVVTQRLVSPGVLVSPGTPILRLAEIDPIRLQANVAEQDLGRIRVGNEVTVTSTKHPGDSFVTKVSAVFPAADPIARTGIVEALTTNADKRFLPGEFVSLSIVTDSVPRAFTVPNAAIVQVTPDTTGTFFTEQEPAVWVALVRAQKGKMLYYCTMHPEVVQDHPGNCPKCHMKLEPMTKGGKYVAHRVPVRLGATDGKRTLVLSGVKAGDQVIWAGHEKLAEGDAVFPTPWGQAPPATLSPAVAAPQNKSDRSDRSVRSDRSDRVRPTAQPGQPAKAVYTCPMHPEVKSNKGGDCPKCGMKLVKAE